MVSRTEEWEIVYMYITFPAVATVETAQCIWSIKEILH